MFKYAAPVTVILSVCLLILGGCFSYHSTKETTQPAVVSAPVQPGESTTNTTTQTDDGTTHQHSTTTTNPY